MKRRDLRITAVAGAAWAVALGVVFVPSVAGAVAIALWSAGALLLTILAWRSSNHAWPAAAVIMLVVAGAVAASVASVMPARESLDLRQWGEVTFTITSSPTFGQDGRLWVDGLAHTLVPGTSLPIRAGVPPDPQVFLGTTLSARGSMKAAGTGDRIVAILFANGDATVVEPAQGVFAIAGQVRAEFTTRATNLPGMGGKLLPGLAVGDTLAVPPELNDAMLASGLSHLTAVSGANCAVVVAGAWFLCAIVGGGRRARIVTAGAALLAFVTLVTPEPSVIRAATMSGLGMISVLLGAPAAGLGILSLACALLLIADPWLAATPGFALSAAATGALIVLASPLAKGLGRWMPAPLALMIAVPLSAQLVCGPIIALFSDQQSLVSVLANLIATPAAPIATVLGLLACLLAFLPPVADLFAAVAWLPSSWIAATAQLTAEMPLATVKAAAGIPSALLVAGLSAALAVLIIRPGGNRWAMRMAGFVTVAVVAVLGVRALITGPLAPWGVPGEWSIAMCDVGQGDAVVLRSEHEVALIDTGPSPEALAACLSGLGVGYIDLLVLTHFDVDHVGATSAIEGRVGTVVYGPTGGEKDELVLLRLAESGARVVAGAGSRGTLGAAQWRALWPRPGTALYAPGNDTSLVIEVSGGGIPRSIFLGDLSAEAQQLLRSAVRGTYDVVKVSHHGSADQDAGLYSSLSPTIALIGVGEKNSYGHPRVETLELLTDAGAVSLRSDTSGRVLVGFADGELVVWTEKSE